jgi:hypothetical protein
MVIKPMPDLPGRFSPKNPGRKWIHKNQKPLRVLLQSPIRTHENREQDLFFSRPVEAGWLYPLPQEKNEAGEERNPNHSELWYRHIRCFS